MIEKGVPKQVNRSVLKKVKKYENDIKQMFQKDTFCPWKHKDISC